MIEEFKKIEKLMSRGLKLRVNRALALLNNQEDEQKYINENFRYGEDEQIEFFIKDLDILIISTKYENKNIYKGLTKDVHATKYHDSIEEAIIEAIASLNNLEKYSDSAIKLITKSK